LRRGYDAQLADRNTKGYDLLVGRPGATTDTRKVQVERGSNYGTPQGGGGRINRAPPPKFPLQVHIPRRGSAVKARFGADTTPSAGEWQRRGPSSLRYMW
jgi:hypothetical protein